MKKLSAILASATVIAMASVPAFAAGINSAEQAVLDKLSEVNTSYNGGFVTNADEMLNQAENYFNTIDMTDAESKEIIADINDAVDYLKSQGASTVKDLNKAQKQELFTYGQKAANVVGVLTTRQLRLFLLLTRTATQLLAQRLQLTVRVTQQLQAMLLLQQALM